MSFSGWMRSSEFAPSPYLTCCIAYALSTQGKKPRLLTTYKNPPAVPRKKSATVRFMDAVQRGIRTVTRPM